MKELEKIIYDKLEEKLQEEYLNYNDFLQEQNISTLPEPHGYYKDGKKLDYREVRRLYDSWCKK